MNIYYQGVDIYTQISLHKCLYESYAEGKSDLLYIVFNDGNRLWDAWNPKKGDSIRVVLGLFDSGTMTVTNVKPMNGKMSLYASSTPNTKNDVSNKSWSRIHFKQLCQEIASRHNLTCEFYGVEDYLYDYLTQQNKPDFLFLQERCVLEGCSFIVYNGKLNVYNESYLELQGSNYNLEIPSGVPFNFEDNMNDAYGKCVIKNGSITGTYESGVSNKTLTKVLSVKMTSQDEANRYAKNILRHANKKMASGVCESGTFLPGYAAGSVVNLQTNGAKSWNGNVFITYVLHDLVKCKTAFKFRKPLEGY